MGAATRYAQSGRCAADVSIYRDGSENSMNRSGARMADYRGIPVLANDRRAVYHCGLASEQRWIARPKIARENDYIRYEPDAPCPPLLSLGVALQGVMLALANTVLFVTVLVRAGDQSEDYLAWAIFASLAIGGVITLSSKPVVPAGWERATCS